MASFTLNFTGSMVFVYDSSNDLITETVVSGHNRDEMYIEISSGLEGLRPGARLNLLIIHSAGVSELSGFLRGVRQGIFEVSIYDERQRDVRASVRRTLKINAVISDMVTDDDSSAIFSPLPVTIENMSTSGILITLHSARLEKGALLQIEFHLNNKTAVVYGEIIREQVQKDGSFAYGCKLHFI